MRAWYRADLLVDDLGAQVTRWRDLSGNGVNTSQLDLTRQPRSARTGGPSNQARVQFDGVDDFLENSTITGIGPAASYTLIVCCKINNLVGTVFASMFDPGPPILRRSLNIVCVFGVVGFGSGNGGRTFATYPLAPSLNRWLVLTGDHETTERTIRENGVTRGTNRAADIVPEPFDLCLGCFEPAPAPGGPVPVPLNGELAELALYSPKLSTPQRDQVEQWMMKRYAIV